MPFIENVASPLLELQDPQNYNSFFLKLDFMSEGEHSSVLLKRWKSFKGLNLKA